MEEAAFRFRTLILLFFLCVWGGLSIFQLYKCTVRDREKMLAQCGQFAWKEALLPGKRGAILDREGNTAVSSILQYDILLTHLPTSPSQRKRLAEKLRKDFPSFQKYPAGKALPLILKENLTAKEIRKFSAKYHFWREVTIRSTMKRVCHYPALAYFIGKTALNDQGEMVGISGLEKEFDAVLSGRSGRCQVMLDRFGVWYPESLRILQSPRHGKDVKTDFLLKEKLAELKGETL